jgi:putative tributyrin esterase
MGLGQFHLQSRALGRQVTFTFSLPDAHEADGRRYPALLQLHGAHDDHSAWSIRSKLPIYLEQSPMIAIMPDGALSKWANWDDRGNGQAYEDFLMQDLLPACEYYFPIQEGRWAIGGLSMGGYGALRLGLKYPDRFASIWAHSSAIYTREMLTRDGHEMTPGDLADADVFEHAQRALSDPHRPRVSFDCGLSDMDWLLEGNRRFHTLLDSISFPHHYAEHEGGHDWEYWDNHVREALQQHIDVLGTQA